MVDSLLEHYVQQTLLVQDRLYEITDSLSEATLMSCMNNNLRRLRDNGYKHVAYNLLIEYGLYHQWRMETEPLQHNYKNIRTGNFCTFDIIMGEDQKNSSKMINFQPWDFWIEGNTIHKRDNNGM
jgi:hypothetical protein